MSGEILSDERKLALEDICETCGLPESKIITYIEEGVVEVQGGDVELWRFSELSVVRIQKAVRLEKDLRLNPAGAALALELMSQIEELKTELNRLQQLSE